jgi:hypothetical protein
MALTVDFQKFGTTFSDAYVKVSNAEYINAIDMVWNMSEDPETPPTQTPEKKLKISFTAKVYPSATSEDVISQEQYHFVSPTADDVIGACYDHLRSLEAFANAVDA